MTRGFQFRFGIAGLAFALPTLLLICGCSTKVGGAVTGTVTLNGKPVKFSMMKIQGENGRFAICDIEDGSYRLELPPGSYNVAIISNPPSTRKDKRGVMVQTDPNWLKQQGYVEVPERYARLQSTPLSLEVTTEPQTKDFDLQP